MTSFLTRFILFREYPSRKVGLAGLSLFMISYLVWIHVIKYYSGENKNNLSYQLLSKFQLNICIFYFRCLGLSDFGCSKHIFEGPIFRWYSCIFSWFISFWRIHQ